MTDVAPSLVVQVVGYILLAGAIYGGIKADLRNMHAQIEVALKSATRAHERIDNHLEKQP